MDHIEAGQVVDRSAAGHHGELVGNPELVPGYLGRGLSLDGMDDYVHVGNFSEYQIAKAYLDARVQTIYAGTSEIMLEIVGRGLKP